MSEIMISSATEDNGKRFWSVFMNGMPLTMSFPDEERIRKFAAGIYNLTDAPAKLTEWDGDTKSHKVLLEKAR